MIRPLRYLVRCLCAGILVLSFLPANAIGQETASQEFGRIEGQVFDYDSDLPLEGVFVLLEGEELTTTTDEAGRYTLEPVPAGTYTVVFLKSGYLSVNVTETEVSVEEPKLLTLPLSPRPVEMSDEVVNLEAFVVTAEQLSEQGERFIELRQVATGSVDFLSLEDMARYGGSDIADVVKRIPGVNVVEGKFAVVRGLSDRYNSTLVNKQPLPSPDPIRQGLPLDLFPTSIIENVVTNKMFLPNFPGNSGGGAFELSTLSFADEWFAEVKIGARSNDNAQDRFLKSPDYTSFSDDLLFQGKNNRSATYNRSDGKLSKFAGENDSPPFNGSMALSFGHGMDYWGERRFRFVFSASYDASSKTKMDGKFQNQYADNSVTLARLFTNFGQVEGIPSFQQGGPRFIGGYPPSAVPEGQDPVAATALFRPGSLAANPTFLVPGTVFEEYIQSQTSVLGGLLLGAQFELDEAAKHVISLTSLNSINTEDTVTRFGNGVQGTLTDSDGQVSPGKDVDLPGQDPADNPAAFQNEGSSFREIVEYEERSLRSFQLTGEHTDDPDNGSINFDWGIGYARVNSDVPLRSNAFFFREDREVDDQYFVLSSSFAGENPFVLESDQYIEQETWSGRVDLDFAIPFSKRREAVISAGAFYEDSNRTITGQNAAYIGEGASEQVRAASPSELSDQQHDLGIDAFSLNGGPYSTEAAVDKNNKASYLMAELPLLWGLKLSGGVRRVELELVSQGGATLAGTQGTGAGQDGFSLQSLLNGFYNTVGGGTITNGDILGWTDAEAQGVIEETYYLPALVLQYDLWEDLTIRVGYSQTFALPSFREISPYFDYEGSTGDIILGNPFLRPSEVESFDIRFDYLLGDEGYAAVSFFHKDVQDPIERVKLKGLADFEFTSFFNNDSPATLKGIELEARHNLGFLGALSDSLRPLENLSFGFNVSLIDAEVDRPPEILLTYFSETNGAPIGPFVDGETPKTRGLYDQPEWIANADVTAEIPQWGTTITVAFYAQSDVLTAVGAGDAQANQLSTLDEYIAEYYQLDLNIKQQITKNLSIRFKVSNLTDTERKLIYDPALVEDYERLTYKDGRTFSLSATYRF